MKARDLIAQIGIGFATAFLVSLVVDHWKAAKALEPLPRPPADGLDNT